MIIVALVATMASAMIWQQFRAVQVEAAERARAQAAWILAGALDFARLILKEDGRTYTALNQPWATPLAESRLNSFLAIDKSNVDDAPEAFLSGSIADAQGKFNLRNLVDEASQGKPPQVNETNVKVLETLCDTAQVEIGLARQVANGLLGAELSRANRSSGDGAFLMPETMSQLTWFGLDPTVIDKLLPYVILLPKSTPVNINTAPKEVLAAVISGLNQGGAEALVQMRIHTGFTSTTLMTKALEKLIGDSALPSSSVVDIKSSYFEVSGRLRLADHVLTEQSLVVRSTSDGSTKVLQRTRTASLDQVAP